VTSKEERIVQVKNKIVESKGDLKEISITGPLIILIIGLVMTVGAVYGIRIIFVIVGILMIIAALIWLRDILRDEKKLNDAIFQYEGELYTLEKEP
jgi:membrane protein implicated in regulation of membrane protease activity